MKIVIGTLRFIAFALVSIGCITGHKLVSLFSGGHTIELGYKTRAIFISIMLKVVNVHIKVFGNLPDPAYRGLVIANHRSYFDPVAILHYMDAVSVAKSQVSNWPIVGTGAEVVGVIWVSREEKDSRLATRKKMLELLKQGYTVLIFPEGTSHTGEKMLELKNASFIMAAENNISVLPVAIEYNSSIYGFVNKETFIPHFFRCFGNWRTTIALHYGEPVTGTDAEEIKRKCVEVIDTNVAMMRKEIGYQQQS